MRDTLNHILSAPLDVGWKVLTALTVLATLEMAKNILRSVRHIFP